MMAPDAREAASRPCGLDGSLSSTFEGEAELFFLGCLLFYYGVPCSFSLVCLSKRTVRFFGELQIKSN